MRRVGLALVGIILIIAIFAPLIAPYTPTEYVGQSLLAPNSSYLLGTNDLGEDIFSRLLYGARTSVSIGFFTALLATFFSLLIGVTSALFAGVYDLFWMRLIDALLAIPTVLIIILIAAFFRVSLWGMIIILSLLSWQQGARVIRNQSKSLLKSNFILAAQGFGAGKLHITLKHLLSHLLPLLSVQLLMVFRRAVFLEAGMSFLGVGDPSLVSWGRMIRQALEYIYLGSWSWWLLPPGVLLTLTILGVVLLEYGRDSQRSI
ncbi:ABC transporter permease [Fuchsiella alkaliacetigena]|uniref:ABC transporter permease n=1 Tax=Fuchsiella alkaliacetigena TaxID=957042 RepID=UPI00200ABE8F|nr:ABC transporter permease [Fuchsiella alkaliacetigena]MCK8824631.1 ABC transporter permease [Fuchsiella alkaliacetigena]